MSAQDARQHRYIHYNCASEAGTGRVDMSDEQVSEPQNTDNSDDTRADTKAIIVMFVAAILMAVHFISGFTFDF
jgi:hypothetical protein